MRNINSLHNLLLRERNVSVMNGISTCDPAISNNEIKHSSRAKSAKFYNLQAHRHIFKHMQTENFL